MDKNRTDIKMHENTKALYNAGFRDKLKVNEYKYNRNCKKY